MFAEIIGEGDNRKLVITVPLQSPTPSATGKTLVVASSRGNQQTSAVVDGQNVVVGFNAYIYKKQA
jgi:hypothetical protein